MADQLQSRSENSAQEAQVSFPMPMFRAHHASLLGGATLSTLHRSCARGTFLDSALCAFSLS